MVKIKEIPNSKVVKNRNTQHYYTTGKNHLYSVQKTLTAKADHEEWEITNNIIFEEELIPTSQENVFENREGHTYYMWPSHNGKMLQKILNNEIIVINGYFKGIFSFKYNYLELMDISSLFHILYETL